MTVSIGTGGAIYTVQEAIVNQYAGLKKRLDHDRPDKPIELREVDEDIGHTLIHFIYTGQYEILGLDSASHDAKTATAFKRSVLAYFSALLCGIDKLGELTKEKMEELSKDLSIFDLQRILEEVYPKLPRDETWLPDRLQVWVKEKLDDDDDATVLTDGRLLDVTGRIPLFDRAVLKGLAEMYIKEKRKNLAEYSEAKLKDQSSHQDPVTVTQEIPVQTPEAKTDGKGGRSSLGALITQADSKFRGPCP